MGSNTFIIGGADIEIKDTRIVKDSSGFHYAIKAGLIKPGQVHLFDTKQFYHLVLFSKENNSENEYIGNRILATTNPKLILQGFERLKYDYSGCIGGYYFMADDKYAEKIYEKQHNL